MLTFLPHVCRKEEVSCSLLYCLPRWRMHHVGWQPARSLLWSCSYRLRYGTDDRASTPMYVEYLLHVHLGVMAYDYSLDLAEIAPAALRGRFIGMQEIGYQMGALVGFWVGYAMSTRVAATNPAQWRTPIALQIPLAGILFIGTFWLPETPRWLTSECALVANVRHLL